MTEDEPAQPSAGRSRRRLVGVLLVLVVVLVLVVGVVALAGSHHRRPATTGVAGSPSSTRPTTDRSTSTRRSPTTTAAPTTSRPTTSATAPTTTRRPVPLQPSKITMVFAGDLLPHSPVIAQAARYAQGTGQRYDFDPMLAPMAPIISGADVAICHLEVQVSPDQAHLTTYPVFGGPVELVDAAKRAGYDGCSNASNHSLDKGLAGIKATLDRFDQDGLHHAGTARSAAEAATTTMYDVKGVKVAHLSYAYGFNGYRVPAGAPWAVDQIDVAKIHADAATARARGADLVVVSLHWGTEGVHAPSADQRAVAAALAPDRNIDLIVGCHAHVVQPIDQIDGTFVVWGMGNQLSNQLSVPNVDGLTVRATAVRRADGRWKVAGIEGIPSWVQAGSYRVLPVVPTLADPATPPSLRAALSASYDRTAAEVLVDHTPGVTIAPKP